MKDVEGVSSLKVEPQVLVPQVAIKMNRGSGQFWFDTGCLDAKRRHVDQWYSSREIYRNQTVIGVTFKATRFSSDISPLYDGSTRLALRFVKDVADIMVPHQTKSSVTGFTAYRNHLQCIWPRSWWLPMMSNVRCYKTSISRRVIIPSSRREPKPRSQSHVAHCLRLLALLILYLDFQSCPVTMIAISLPLALLGESLVFGWGRHHFVGSLIGFVTILGVAARNGVMLLSHYRHIQQEENVPFGLPLVLQGAQERLAPILMTALTTGLALVPLLISGNKPGQEIEYPMAFVILSGIACSLLINLFVLPVMYWLFGEPKRI
ncbi:MAG: efflux RND transporter permease subunit [Pirellulaceae bacterium]